MTGELRLGAQTSYQNHPCCTLLFVGRFLSLKFELGSDWSMFSWQFPTDGNYFYKACVVSPEFFVCFCFFVREYWTSNLQLQDQEELTHCFYFVKIQTLNTLNQTKSVQVRGGCPPSEPLISHLWSCPCAIKVILCQPKTSAFSFLCQLIILVVIIIKNECHRQESMSLHSKQAHQWSVTPSRCQSV